MSNDISWVLELDIKEGGFDDFESVMSDMVAATRDDEPGTINYEWFVSADRKQCHIYERYVDSAAVLVHLGNFQEKFADRFLAVLTPTRFQVYGDPGQEVRDALAGLGAVHLEQIAGFAR